MHKFYKKMQKELLRRQLEIIGQQEEFEELLKCDIRNCILDDSFANILRLILFAKTVDEEEELMILLSFSREKLKRMIAEECEVEMC